ncbi:hypothetical protein [Streptomyces uncialis]|uniref:hypothetical protein n=1 Tax=Streptomyces uncialis TaxID=1048205 RepID=UPI0038656980|nr:hypothetical protein OG268_28000 [Streptomyces uncialis]
MGWAVLYIAFGIVALWLLGEVLLQYKARLRWRLLAFSGFLAVVIGVLLPSVIVIGIGAMAFAVGQTYVTMSFRRGFSTGWAIGGRPGASKRRRGGGPQEPALQVSGLEADDNPYAAGDFGAAPHPGNDGFPYEAAGPEPVTMVHAPVHAPEPMPDDTGGYGVYSESPQSPASPGQDFGYDTYSGYDQGHGYDQGGQRYAAYSDPYIGTQTYDGVGASYDPYGRQGHEQAPQHDPYAPGGGYQETPPGGVWVPQQRGTPEGAPYSGEPAPDQQHYPYPPPGDGYRSDQDTGYDERQPYHY